MKKRVLALFLMLSMCLTLWPVSAFAADKRSGTCGDGVTWTAENGVLTISGTGEMTNYGPMHSTPWAGVVTVNKVVIDDGVLNIGDYAFCQCDSLSDITIPDSVTSIGAKAFYRCESLSDITIPDSVTSIGANAFYWCHSLKSIEIPSGVNTVGDGAFQNCKALTDVYVNGFCSFPTTIELRDEEGEILDEGTCAFAGVPHVTIHIPYFEAPWDATMTSAGYYSDDLAWGHKMCNGDCNLTWLIEDKSGTWRELSTKDPAYTDDMRAGAVELSLNQYTDVSLNVMEDDIEAVWGLCKFTAPRAGYYRVSYAYEAGAMATLDVLDRTDYGCMSFVREEAVAVQTLKLEAGETCYLRVYSEQPMDPVAVYVQEETDDWYISSEDTVELNLFDNYDLTPGLYFSDNLFGGDLTFGFPEEVYSVEMNLLSGDDVIVLERERQRSDAEGDSLFHITGMKPGKATLEVSITYCGVTKTKKISCTVTDVIVSVEGIPDTGKVGDVFIPQITLAKRSGTLEHYTDTPCGEEYTWVYRADGYFEVDGEIVTALSVNADGVYTAQYAGPGIIVIDIFDGEEKVTEVRQFLWITDSTCSHSWDDGTVTTEATCTKDGVKTYTCQTCGETKTETIAAHGHSWDSGKVTTKATCTKDGVKTYTCQNCGETKTEKIAATGHNYETKVVKPTCTEKGYTLHTCKNCNDSYKDTYVDAKGHNWDNGTVTKEPTATEQGEKTYTCTVCGETKTEAIAVLGNPFTDLVETSSYYNAVLWAVDKGITKGTSETEFSPKADCTRAQIVTFLWRYAGEPEPTTKTHNFVDLVEDSTYYNAVLWAVEQGITNGLDDTHFGPKEPCTRAQIVTFLWRAAGEPQPSGKKHSFTDIVKGSSYYDAVLWAVEKGITTGVDSTHFNPKATCTRAQGMTFLWRYNKTK